MGDIYTNPPQSRNEAILRATIDGTEYTAPPQSRIEDLLIELKEAIEGGGGTTVEANPAGEVTGGELGKLKVDSDIYSVVTKAVNDLANYYTKSEVYTKTEVNNIAQARFAVVAELPTEDIQTNVIYLVPKSTAQTNNDYDEYIYALQSTNPDVYGWEKIGDTEIDLSDYVTTSALNTALANYTTTADLTTLLAGKQNTLTFDTTPTAQSTNPVTSGGIKTSLDKKANGEGLTFKMVNGVLNVTTPIEIVPFTTGTDAQIKAMIDAYYADAITWEEMGWQVGDTRVIHLDAMQAPNPNSSDTWAAQDITVVIVAHDHTDLAMPIYGHTKACITVQTREALSGINAGDEGNIYVNGDDVKDTVFTKWVNLYLREYLNDKVYNALSSNFKSMVKQSKHYYHTTYNGTKSEQVTDKVFAPSYAEIFGTSSYMYYNPTSPTEGTQFPYYQTSSHRIKNINNNGTPNGTSVNWWTSSTSSYHTSDYGYLWNGVKANDGVDSYGGYSSCSIAPTFAI